MYSKLSSELVRERSHQVVAHSGFALFTETDAVIFHSEVRLIVRQVKCDTNAPDAMARKSVLGRVRDELIDDKSD